MQAFLRPCTPQCAITCINICANVKGPVDHVRVLWIMETLNHPACTVGWLARLCHSWLSPVKATRISHGRNPNGTIQLLKKREREKKASTNCVSNLVFPCRGRNKCTRLQVFLQGLWIRMGKSSHTCLRGLVHQAANSSVTRGYRCPIGSLRKPGSSLNSEWLREWMNAVKISG